MKRAAIFQVLPTTKLPLKVFKTLYHPSYLSEHDQFKQFHRLFWVVISEGFDRLVVAIHGGVIWYSFNIRRLHLVDG